MCLLQAKAGKGKNLREPFQLINRCSAGQRVETDLARQQHLWYLRYGEGVIPLIKENNWNRKMPQVCKITHS